MERPYKLAIWRLTQNMPGAGPRLRPLQRQWDQEQRAADEQSRIATVAEDFRRIEVATTDEQRDQLVVAMGELFGAAEGRVMLQSLLRNREEKVGRVANITTNIKDYMEFPESQRLQVCPQPRSKSGREHVASSAFRYVAERFSASRL